MILEIKTQFSFELNPFSGMGGGGEGKYPNSMIRSLNLERELL